jgi:hypothetical protein
MQEYVTAFTAAKLMRHTNDKKLKMWIEFHGLAPDAVVVDYLGNKTRLWKLENLEHLAEQHKNDVSMRGAIRGRTPEGFSYTRIDG